MIRYMYIQGFQDVHASTSMHWDLYQYHWLLQCDKPCVSIWGRKGDYCIAMLWHVVPRYFPRFPTRTDAQSCEGDAWSCSNSWTGRCRENGRSSSPTSQKLFGHEKVHWGNIYIINQYINQIKCICQISVFRFFESPKCRHTQACHVWSRLDLFMQITEHSYQVLSKLQRKACCSFPIFWCSLWWTCLEGKVFIVVVNKTHANMFAKAVLVAALVLTNLAPLSNLPLTPRSFSASGSAVNQSILRPSEIRLHVIYFSLPIWWRRMKIVRAYCHSRDAAYT